MDNYNPFAHSYRHLHEVEQDERVRAEAEGRVPKEYFRCRNFRVEKLSRKEKCAKFCAFRVDKLSRMDPIG